MAAAGASIGVFPFERRGARSSRGAISHMASGGEPPERQTAGRQRGVSTPISGLATAKWRTCQVRMVAALAFTAHAAMSMS